ncbi:E3 ubiquitin-protein ligase RNF186-like [Lampris incognitus]|uniref:E3 ubiquitin-protein ligase RNF186-like n=1 Tax=Lampris incognitus TaxID=2546036 RepID=UPI0024B501BF|nr:E3 ubiquitin-protein ligase RNF186-like [Lampris incognitus]
MAEARALGGDRATAPFPTEDRECKVCYSRYDLDRHAPKVLDCLHTFCQECLSSLHFREGGGWRVGWPLCRRRTPVPEYQVRNLPDNVGVLAETAPDRLPPDGPAADCAPAAHAQASAADAQERTGSGQACMRVALATGCACAILSFLSSLLLLFTGLILVHNFNSPPSPIGPVCLSVASVLAMFSVILTWLACWLQHRRETETGHPSTTSSNAIRRNATSTSPARPVPPLLC